MAAQADCIMSHGCANQARMQIELQRQPLAARAMFWPARQRQQGAIDCMHMTNDRCRKLEAST